MARRRARPAVSRRARVVLGLALLALAAVVCIDCLNLIQSEAWTDLTRAPHLAAVSRSPGKASHQVEKRPAGDQNVAVVPPPVAVPVVVCALVLLSEIAWLCGIRPRVRQPSRAPPALRFSSSARS